MQRPSSEISIEETVSKLINRLVASRAKKPPVPSPLIGVDTPSKSTKPEGIQICPECEALKEAVIWMSGADDFAIDGKARVGFEKIVQPLLRSKGGELMTLDAAAQNTVREVCERKIAELEAQLAEERAKNETYAEGLRLIKESALDRLDMDDEIVSLVDYALNSHPIKPRPASDTTALREALEEIADKLREYPILGGETCTCSVCTCLRIARDALRSSPSTGKEE
jgi:hypothetical protein